MVPYVRKSFNKHFREGLKYAEGRKDKIEAYKNPSFSPIEEISIDDRWYKDCFSRAYEYAYVMTTKEVYQAAEALFHNLNSLQSRSGNQLPFSSVNFRNLHLARRTYGYKSFIRGIYKRTRKIT